MRVETVWIDPEGSSTIKRLRYAFDAEILEVLFKTGSIYHYSDIDLEKFSDLVYSNSYGSFFHNHIKDKHDYFKLGFR